MPDRQQYLDELLQRVRAVSSTTTNPNVVFLTGEAGIGKSTLLRAVKEACEQIEDGPRVVIVECSTPLAGRSIGDVEALQPWIAVMNQLSIEGDHKAGRRKKLIAELAMAWVKHVPIIGQALEFSVDTVRIVHEHKNAHKHKESAPVFAANQQQLFQQCINVLEKIIDDTPLVIALDDAHWADASSLNLLFTAARQLQGKPILFCVAYRPDDAATANNGEGHPVVHIRNELARYGLCVELGVPQLSAKDLDVLLRGRYPEYVPNGRFETWLSTSSGGNALFVTQFLSTLEQDHLVDLRTGVVRDGFEQLAIPDSAFAVVQERLRRLSDDARDVLRYASVEGETFTVDVLSKLTDRVVLKLLQLLRTVAERNGVVQSLGKQRIYVEESTAYKFLHSIIHRALYESLEAEERELLHRVVYESLLVAWESAKTKGTGRAGIAARLAAHAEILGDVEGAARALFDGAEASWEEFAESETLTQLSRAEELLLRSADESNAVTELRGKILYLRADVDSLHARYINALGHIRHGRRLFEQTGNTDSIAKGWSREADVQRLKGDYADAKATALTGLRLLGDASNSLSEFLLILDIGNAEFFSGHFAEAELWYDKAMQNARSRNDGMGIMKTLCNMGYLSAMKGDTDKSVHYLRECLTMPEVKRNRDVEATVFLNYGLVQVIRGEYDDAQKSYESALVLFESAGDRPGLAKALNNLANLSMKRGILDNVEDQLNRARSLVIDTDDHEVAAHVYTNLAELAIRRKQYSDVLENCTQALPFLEAIGDRERIASITYALGFAHQGLGNADTAREFLERALKLARECDSQETIELVLIALAQH